MELYNSDSHICLAFRNLVTGGEAVQANQFLIANNGQAALVDPGGELTYTRLFMEANKYVPVKQLSYVIASHQDPDIVASLSRWLSGTDATIVVPQLWERFIPHFTRPGQTKDRVLAMPDRGMDIPIGNSVIKALPAHFLHAEGNFQFYDPISKTLFSGDVAANLGPDELLDKPATALNEVIAYMDGFHKRYMNSNRVCRFWVNMVKQLDISMIAPQHGRALVGKAIPQFLTYMENLQCGIDLMTQNEYSIP